MTTAVLAGGTGLVGGHILSTLLEAQSITKLHAFARRELPSNPKLDLIQSTETSTWSTLFPNGASIFYSSLGTTRAEAGGLANQRKVDYDLTLDLATAAKQAGVKTFVIVTVAGANPSALVPYTKMKGEIENKVIELGFDNCIIVRPGLIVGDRKQSRVMEGMARSVAKAMGSLHSGLKDFWAQDAEVIARAAYTAGQQSLTGDNTKTVTYLEQSDIVRLGRTEWKGLA